MSSICKRLRSMKLDKNCKDKLDDENEDIEVRPAKKQGNGHKIPRGEMSRLAAKARRDKEAIEFTTLTNMLPFSKETIEKLDKNSIIRLIISYMRMKQHIRKEMADLATKHSVGEFISPRCEDNGGTLVPTVVPSIHKTVSTVNTDDLTIDKPNNITTLEEGKLMLEAINGFVIHLDRKKTIMYISENVKSYLGLKQEYLVGQSIKEFIHPNDKPQLRKQFNLQLSKHGQRAPTSMDIDDEPPDLDDERTFYIRMKFNLQKPGTKVKQSGFTLVHWKGRLKMKQGNRPNSYVIDGLLCVCRPMQNATILDISVDGNMFVSRHDMAMTFTFCDPKIITLIGYEPNELIGKTAYQFHNPLDAEKVGNCHSNLIVKGSSVSKYYRFLGKNCEWVWMQTRATIIYNTKNVPQYVVCMNYIISEEEGERFLMMEQEQDGSQFSSNHFTGVMDLSMPHAKPVDSHIIVELNDDHCSEHSDAGYGSSSPYSSRHSGCSPCSVDSGNTKDIRPATRMTDDEETNMSVDAVESEFPMFLQEVTKTINSGVPNDRDVLEFLESLDKDSSAAEPEAVPNGQFSEVPQLFTDPQDPWNSSSQSCLQMLLTDGLMPSDPVCQDPAVSMPIDFSTSNSNNGPMFSGPAVTMPSSNIGPMLSGPVMTAVSSNIGPMFPCPAVTAPPSYPASVSNSIVSSGISTITNSDMVTVSSANGNVTDVMDNGIISSPHSQTFSDSCDSQEFNLNSSANCVNMTGNPRNGDVFAHGNMNVNVGVLDHTYFSGLNSDALPKEITDFCMQYCNTLADNQANALISEYTQNGLTDLNNIMSHYPASLSQKTVNSQVMGQNKHAGTIPPISALSKRHLKNSMAQPGLNNGLSRKNLGTQTPEIIKKRQPANPRKNGNVSPRVNNMTYRAQLQLQQLKQQQQKQQALQQQQKQKQQQYIKYPGQVQCQKVDRIPSVSVVQPPRNYFKPKASPQQRSSFSSSTTRSPTSSCVSPGGSILSPTPSYNKPCSENNIMSSLQDTNAQISDTSKNLVNNCMDGNHLNLQSMSELEKMLRGYVSFNGSGRSCDNNVTNQQQSIGNSDLSNNSAATLLEKMLTGQLSGAQYHALEKQRTGTSVPITRH